MSSRTSTSSSRFAHGRFFLTSRIVTCARLGQVDVLQCLERHLTGDWGDAPAARKVINDLAAAASRGAIVSRYQISTSMPIVIVTNGERSLTKVMSLAEFLDDISD